MVEPMRHDIDAAKTPTARLSRVPQISRERMSRPT